MAAVLAADLFYQSGLNLFFLVVLKADFNQLGAIQSHIDFIYQSLGKPFLPHNGRGIEGMGKPLRYFLWDPFNSVTCGILFPVFAVCWPSKPVGLSLSG